jgi:hypothetical protein
MPAAILTDLENRQKISAQGIRKLIWADEKQRNDEDDDRTKSMTDN